MSKQPTRKYVLASASQIATVVGVTPQAVRSALKTVKTSGRDVRGGNLTELYLVDDLPTRFQDRINIQKETLNYRSVDAVLSDPKPQWQPPVPMDAQPLAAVESAHSLKRALAYYIPRRNDSSLKPGELMRRAWQDYCSIFGKQVSKRYVEMLAKMVLDRDNGREEFDRLEIYLPESGKLKPAVATSQNGTVGPRLEAVEDTLNDVRDIGSLTPIDRTIIWKAAIEDYITLMGDGLTDKKAKRVVLDFLLVRVPMLCESASALRVQFGRKLDAYENVGIAGLTDKRRANSGPRRASKIFLSIDDLNDDERLLMARANAVGGGLSQAFRELYRGVQVSPETRWQFSPEFRARYKFDPRQNKSYVPESLRTKLRPLLKSIQPLNHGTRAAKLAAPSARRDWSNVLAGDWYQSDDETGNHYIYFENAHGEYEYEGMRFDVLRPQILPMVDVRTDFVMSVMLLCQRHYTSQTIRSLIAKTCLDPRVGLPAKGFYFEGNIWQARNLHAMVDFGAISDAFSMSGVNLQIRQATTPKAKIIERLFSQEQNIMQALPGYAGRNERSDGYEKVRWSLNQMKKVGQPKKEEKAPWDFFMSAERYLDQLQTTYEAFNNEPQNGMRLDGMSPAEGWRELSGGRARHVLPVSLRYLLATEQTDARVTHEGICLRLGSAKRYYSASPRLGSLIGEQVLVRRNSDFPDHVIVTHPKTDPEGLHPFVVEHDAKMPAIYASASDFEKMKKRRDQFTENQRSLFRMLQIDFSRTVRNENLGPAPVRDAGLVHELTETAQIAQGAERQSAEGKVRRISAEVGLSNARVKDPVLGLADLERAKNIRQKLLAKQIS